MKLFFDENLSRRLVEAVEMTFPGSAHPDLVGMRGATDADIWQVAARGGFAIVSKDNDFRQRAFLYGPPPKVIWLAVGNVGTPAIRRLLVSQTDVIRAFGRRTDEALLPLCLR